jgi:hypothetical protein
LRAIATLLGSWRIAEFRSGRHLFETILISMFRIPVLISLGVVLGVLAITMLLSFNTAPEIDMRPVQWPTGDARVTPQSDKSGFTEGRKWFFRGETALLPSEHALPFAPHGG